MIMGDGPWKTRTSSNSKLGLQLRVRQWVDRTGKHVTKTQIEVLDRWRRVVVETTPDTSRVKNASSFRVIFHARYVHQQTWAHDIHAQRCLLAAATLSACRCPKDLVISPRVARAFFQRAPVKHIHEFLARISDHVVCEGVSPDVVGFWWKLFVPTGGLVLYHTTTGRLFVFKNASPTLVGAMETLHAGLMFLRSPPPHWTTPHPIMTLVRRDAMQRWSDDLLDPRSAKELLRNLTRDIVVTSYVAPCGTAWDVSLGIDLWLGLVPQARLRPPWCRSPQRPRTSRRICIPLAFSSRRFQIQQRRQGPVPLSAIRDELLSSVESQHEPKRPRACKLGLFQPLKASERELRCAVFAASWTLRRLHRLLHHANGHVPSYLRHRYRDGAWTVAPEPWNAPSSDTTRKHPSLMNMHQNPTQMKHLGNKEIRSALMARPSHDHRGNCSAPLLFASHSSLGDDTLYSPTPTASLLQHRAWAPQRRHRSEPTPSLKNTDVVFPLSRTEGPSQTVNNDVTAVVCPRRSRGPHKRSLSADYGGRLELGTIMKSCGLTLSECEFLSHRNMSAWSPVGLPRHHQSVCTVASRSEWGTLSQDDQHEEQSSAEGCDVVSFKAGSTVSDLYVKRVSAENMEENPSMATSKCSNESRALATESNQSLTSMPCSATSPAFVDDREQALELVSWTPGSHRADQRPMESENELSTSLSLDRLLLWQTLELSKSHCAQNERPTVSSDDLPVLRAPEEQGSVSNSFVRQQSLDHAEEHDNERSHAVVREDRLSVVTQATTSTAPHELAEPGVPPFIKPSTLSAHTGNPLSLTESSVCNASQSTNQDLPSSVRHTSVHETTPLTTTSITYQMNNVTLQATVVPEKTAVDVVSPRSGPIQRKTSSLVEMTDTHETSSTIAQARTAVTDSPPCFETLDSSDLSILLQEQQPHELLTSDIPTKTAFFWALPDTVCPSKYSPTVFAPRDRARRSARLRHVNKGPTFAGLFVGRSATNHPFKVQSCVLWSPFHSKKGLTVSPIKSVSSRPTCFPSSVPLSFKESRIVKETCTAKGLHRVETKTTTFTSPCRTKSQRPRCSNWMCPLREKQTVETQTVSFPESPLTSQTGGTRKNTNSVEKNIDEFQENHHYRPEIFWTPRGADQIMR